MLIITINHSSFVSFLFFFLAEDTFGVDRPCDTVRWGGPRRQTDMGGLTDRQAHGLRTVYLR